MKPQITSSLWKYVASIYKNLKAEAVLEIWVSVATRK